MKKKILLLFLFVSCTSLKIETLPTVVKDVVKGINKNYTKDKANILETVSELMKYEKPWKGGFLISREELLENGVILERIKKKSKKNKKVIFYVHGGAFVYPLTNIYRDFAKYMIDINDNYDIVLLNYRHLPYYRYPSGNIDFDNGLEWVLKNYEKVYVMGESAGGNIIMSGILKRRDENKQLPNGLILYSPFLDISYTLSSRFTNQKTDLIIGSEYGNDYHPSKLLVDNTYFINEVNKFDPYISPVFGNMKNIPPTYIEVDKSEMLYDDSIILANKLKNLGIKYKLVEVEGLFHAYQLMPFTNEREKSVKNVFDFINSIEEEKR